MLHSRSRPIPVTGWLCLTAALALFACAATVAARFGWRLGHDEIDRIVTAAVCVVAALFALVMLSVSTTLWRRGERASALAAALVWLLAVGWDVVGAVGFSAANRSETVAAARLEQTAWTDTRAEVTALERALAVLEQRQGWVPQHRPTEAVAAEMTRLEISPHWAASVSCSAPTTKRQRSLCREYAQLAAEKALGEEARTLAEEIATVQRQLVAARSASRTHDTAGATTDAQAVTLASIAMGTRAPSEDSVWWTTVALCGLLAGLLLTSGVVFDCALRLLGWADGQTEPSSRATTPVAPPRVVERVRDQVWAVSEGLYGDPRVTAVAA